MQFGIQKGKYCVTEQFTASSFRTRYLPEKEARTACKDAGHPFCATPPVEPQLKAWKPRK